MCRVATQNHFFAATNKMCCIAARKTPHQSVIVIIGAENGGLMAQLGSRAG